jgi:hypothetical protein
MASLILALQELSLPQASLQAWEKMGDSLGIIPYMGARSDAATATIIKTTLKGPEGPVFLSQYSGRFQNAQVGRYSFKDLRRKIGGKKGLTKLPGFIPEIRIVRFPEM